MPICAAHAIDLQLAWDASPDAEIVGYALYYAPEGALEYSRVSAGSGTAGTLTGLQPGVTYLVYSRAITILGGESPASNLVSFTVPANENVLQNGSFESGLSGWSAGGHFALDTVASDGSASIRFNAGSAEPTGMLVQTFPTTPGQSYQVSFDFAAASLLNLEQSLAVSVKGTSVLAAQLFSVWSDGSAAPWQTETFGFTADADTASILLQDASQTTDGVDLLLDHVQVNAAP